MGCNSSGASFPGCVPNYMMHSLNLALTNPAFSPIQGVPSQDPFTTVKIFIVSIQVIFLGLLSNSILEEISEWGKKKLVAFRDM